MRNLPFILTSPFAAKVPQGLPASEARRHLWFRPSVERACGPTLPPAPLTTATLNLTVPVGDCRLTGFIQQRATAIQQRFKGAIQ
jgi:hypothetical protein